MAVMTAAKLVEKAIDIARNYKTLYVMGCFGAPMTPANKQRYINNGAADHYNARADRRAMINAASADTFGFDCVCLIKGILWGWSGDKNNIYGGAKYGSNGVQDYNADGTISICKGVSTNFSKIEVGEALWCKGHIGIYIGGGLAVECTPKWQNKVQITAVGNIGVKSGYNTRTWTKHGKLPWVDYSETQTAPEEPAKPTKPKALANAEGFDKAAAGAYKVTASALNLRYGPSTDYEIIQVLKNGATVRCYGYYSEKNGARWLCVAAGSVVGYVHSGYLVRA